MILTPTNLETHPTGGAVNAIVVGNWEILNNIFAPGSIGNKCIANGILKLDDTELGGIADGKVLVWNASEQKVEVRDHLSLDRLALAAHSKLELVGDPAATPDPIDPTMPAADYPRTMVYCYDGDGGNPCLAVSNGTDWKIVAFSTTLTP